MRYTHYAACITHLKEYKTNKLERVFICRLYVKINCSAVRNNVLGIFMIYPTLIINIAFKCELYAIYQHLSFCCLFCCNAFCLQRERNSYHHVMIHWCISAIRCQFERCFLTHDFFCSFVHSWTSTSRALGDKSDPRFPVYPSQCDWMAAHTHMAYIDNPR